MSIKNNSFIYMMQPSKIFINTCYTQFNIGLFIYGTYFSISQRFSAFLARKKNRHALFRPYGSTYNTVMNGKCTCTLGGADAYNFNSYQESSSTVLEPRDIKGSVTMAVKHVNQVLL